MFSVFRANWILLIKQIEITLKCYILFQNLTNEKAYSKNLTFSCLKIKFKKNLSILKQKFVLN